MASLPIKSQESVITAVYEKAPGVPVYRDAAGNERPFNSGDSNLPAYPVLPGQYVLGITVESTGETLLGWVPGWSAIG